MPPSTPPLYLTLSISWVFDRLKRQALAGSGPAHFLPPLSTPIPGLRQHTDSSGPACFLFSNLLTVCHSVSSCCCLPWFRTFTPAPFTRPDDRGRNKALFSSLHGKYVWVLEKDARFHQPHKRRCLSLGTEGLIMC